MDWLNFWSEYRNNKIVSKEDLFFQVGKTINKKAMSDEQLQFMIEDIATSLSLQKEDTLLELCCGNGLLTKPLSQIVSRVYAFDFLPQMIENANQFNSNTNIEYKIGDAKTNFFELFKTDCKPNKYLMNASLGYFAPTDLFHMLKVIKNKAGNFQFLSTEIPSFELKDNFYNTPERIQKYEEALAKGDDCFDGMGRWWKTNEIKEIANSLGISVHIKEKTRLFNYRMTALFSFNDSTIK